MSTPPRRTRVLIAIPNFSGGGAERVALTLAQALDPERFSVTVFGHERWGRFVGTLPPHVREVTKNESYARHQLPGLFLKTLSLAREHDVLVGANEGRAAFLTLLAGRLANKPVVCWLHTAWEVFGRHWSWRQRAALPAYARADALVTVSQGVADSFARLVRVDPAKLNVIFNGVPGDEIRRKAEEPLPPEHEAAFARPAVVCVGRLDDLKGQEYLVEAHARLRARGVLHHLVLIGEGGRADALREQAARLGVADSVFQLGFQPNPYRYMRRARVFALSSMVEGLGLVLAEAMFCGLPVVSFDSPTGPREVLEGGRYGPLVPLRDVDGLAEALGRILGDPAEHARWTALAAERAPTFDLDRFAARWGALLDQVRRPAE